MEPRTDVKGLRGRQLVVGGGPNQLQERVLEVASMRVAARLEPSDGATVGP